MDTISVLKMKTVLEIGCTTVWTYLTLPIAHLKTVRMVNFVM